MLRPTARRARRILLAVTFSGLLLAAPAGAAVIDVTTTGDPGPGSTTSLRQAVAAATAGSTINVPAGTYALASGPITIDKSVTIVGAGADATTVTTGSGRLFQLSSAGATELSGMTITGGRVIAAGGIEQGGGISADAGSPLILRGVRLTDNLVDVSSAVGSGGIAYGGGIATSSDLTLIDTTVSGNRAQATGAPTKPGGIVYGGGIRVGGSGTTLALTDSSVDDNTVDVSGGSNAAGGIGYGGGLAANGAVTLTRSAVTRSQARSNATGTGPGGIVDGGGLQTFGAVTLTNSTIAQNTADASAANGPGGIAEGGGVFAGNGLTALNATLNANQVLADGTPDGIAHGGNIRVSAGGALVTNSIVAAGAGDPGRQNCDAAYTSGGHNIDSLSQCGFTSTGDRTNTDPLLGPLQDNGGRSLTAAITSASPAFDGAGTTCPATDQRGVTRPQFAACDIGAFELAPPPPPAPPAPAPAPAPTAPAAAPKPLPALFGTKGVVAGLPGTKACLSRRAFTIRVRKLAGVDIAKATVAVNGKRVAVRSGKRLTAAVNLRNLPKGRYTVKITVTLADGRVVTGTRRYRTCTPKRKGTTKPKV